MTPTLSAPTLDLRPASGAARSPGCPPDDELAGFVDGSLPAQGRSRLEAHVDSCAGCRVALSHLAALTNPSTPRVVGRYRLDAELGRGGMGTVWRAWDPALEREVAVKLLHPELDDERWRQRALREARALARLQHPNVIAVHDVGQADGEVFIATELIDGEPLDRWQRGRSVPELLAAYAQAARGLAAAHAIGLIHRDVKPSNILVSRSGRVCIGDFGLATSARRAAPALLGAAPANPGVDVRADRDAAEAARREPGEPTLDDRHRRSLPQLTADGVILGTPAYMAPEQQLGAPVDASADQYALCLSLAEALLGYRPLDGTGAAALAASGVAAPWPQIARCLSLRPADRFPDLAPLIAALEGSAVAPPRRARRRRLALVLLGLGAVAALALWLAPSRPAPSTKNTASPAPKQATSRTWAAARPPAAWAVSTAGPWRLSEPGRLVAFLDERHAAVIPSSPYHQNTLMIVELETGQLAAPLTLPEDASIDELVHTRDGVLALGSSGEQSAAWRLTATPLAATPIAVPEARRGRTLVGAPAAAVSPDGTLLVWCEMYRQPTLRDARTLAVLRRFSVASCQRARFSAANRVVLGEEEVDLTRGTTRRITEFPFRVAGPFGRTLEAPDRGLATAVVKDPHGQLLQRELDFHAGVRWTPDGVAVLLGYRNLSLRPGPTGETRNTRPALETSSRGSFDVNATHAILLNESAMELIDLSTGESRAPSGNLERVRAVAPFEQGVVTAADRLRWWGPEGVRTVTELQARAVAPMRAVARVAVLDNSGGVWLWDPVANQLQRMGEADPQADMRMTTTDDEVWFAAERQVLRAGPNRAPRPWITFRDHLLLVAMDPPRSAAWMADETLWVADLERRAVTKWRATRDCIVAPNVRLLDHQVVADKSTDLELVDSASPHGSLHVPTNDIGIFDVTADGDFVIASARSLLLWRPGQPQVWSWNTSVSSGATPIAVTSDADHVAVGYDTGATVTTSLANLRAHGASQPITPDGDPSCTLTPAGAGSFAELGLQQASP